MHIDNGVTVILSRVGWVRNKVFFMSKLTAMVYFGQRKCCGLHVACMWLLLTPQLSLMQQGSHRFQWTLFRRRKPQTGPKEAGQLVECMRGT